MKLIEQNKLLNKGLSEPFGHLVKLLSKLDLASIDKYMLNLLDTKLIKKREYNSIMKRVLINKNINLGL